MHELRISTLGLASALTLSLLLPGCGNGDKPAAPGVGASGGAGGAGGGASGGASGKVGLATGGTLGGGGGKAGSGGTAGITCGGAPCTPMYTPACCTVAGTGESGNRLEFVGRAADKCGTDLSQYSDAIAGICLQLNQPGTLDSTCPNVKSPTPGQPDMKGCCTEQGFCGAFEGFLALGCNYPGARGKPCGVGRDGGGQETDAAMRSDAAH